MQRTIICLALTVLEIFLPKLHLFTSWGWKGKSSAFFLCLKYPSPHQWVNYFCLFAGIFINTYYSLLLMKSKLRKAFVGIKLDSIRGKETFPKYFMRILGCHRPTPPHAFCTSLILVHILVHTTVRKSADREDKEASPNDVAMHKPSICLLL